MADQLKILIGANIKNITQSQLDAASRGLVLKVDRIQINQAQLQQQLQQATTAVSRNVSSGISRGIQQGASMSVRIFDNLQTRAVQTGMQGRLQGLTNTFERLQRSGNFSQLFNPQQISAVNQQLGALQNSMGAITNNRMAQQWNTQFGALNTQIRGMNNQITALGRPVQSLGAQFALAAKKMIEWTVVGGLIFGVMRQIQDGVKYVFELSNALNEIRIVTGQSEQQVNQLAQSYNNLAKEMNVTTTEIAKTSVELYRQGLNQQQVDERMKSIIQYAKISSISLEQSNKIITATMNATGESATKVIDIFAQLGDKTAFRFLNPSAI